MFNYLKKIPFMFLLFAIVSSNVLFATSSSAQKGKAINISQKTYNISKSQKTKPISFSVPINPNVNKPSKSKCSPTKCNSNQTQNQVTAFSIPIEWLNGLELSTNQEKTIYLPLSTVDEYGNPISIGSVSSASSYVNIQKRNSYFTIKTNSNEVYETGNITVTLIKNNGSMYQTIQIPYIIRIQKNISAVVNEIWTVQPIIPINRYINQVERTGDNTTNYGFYGSGFDGSIFTFSIQQEGNEIFNLISDTGEILGYIHIVAVQAPVPSVTISTDGNGGLNFHVNIGVVDVNEYRFCSVLDFCNDYYFSSTTNDIPMTAEQLANAGLSIQSPITGYIRIFREHGLVSTTSVVYIPNYSPSMD